MANGQKKLVIAAAGTGGHVMPALAVARLMRSRGWQVTWIGTQTGMEGRLIAHDNIPFIGLDFRGVRGHGALGYVSGGIKLVRSSLRCWRLLSQIKPDVFFSTGGYVAVPVSFGARRNSIRTVVMNCDADLLLSTKVILRDCWAVACGFAGSARAYAGDIGRITGNPVRADIEAIPAPQERLKGRSGPLRLFVFGGSLGAQVLNDVVPQTLELFEPDHRPEVIHQCGRGNLEQTKALYDKMGVKAKVVEFIDDMAAMYNWCDLVICRAGATSVAELSAAGVASILVPFVAQTTKHQLGNAKYMASRDAAVLVEQKLLTPEYLFGVLARIHREQIESMSQKARALSRPNATKAVAELIETVSEMKKRGPLPDLQYSL